MGQEHNHALVTAQTHLEWSKAHSHRAGTVYTPAQVTKRRDPPLLGEDRSAGQVGCSTGRQQTWWREGESHKMHACTQTHTHTHTATTPWLECVLHTEEDGGGQHARPCGEGGCVHSNSVRDSRVVAG